MTWALWRREISLEHAGNETPIHRSSSKSPYSILYFHSEAEDSVACMGYDKCIQHFGWETWMKDTIWET